MNYQKSYEIERNRKRNVNRSDQELTDAIPNDLFVSHYDETNVYLPPTAFNDFARELIKDRSMPDTTLIEDPVSTKERNAGALSLRMNGHRGEAEDYAESQREMFTGDMDNSAESDIRGVGLKQVEQTKFRARYLNLKPEGEESVVESRVTNFQVQEKRQLLTQKLKDVFKYLTDSKDNMNRKSNMNFHIAREALNNIVNEIGGTGDRYLEDGPENMIMKVKKSARLGERAPKHLRRDDYNDALFGDNYEALVKKNKKYNISTLNGESIHDATFTDVQYNAIYKSVAGVIKGIEKHREVVNDESQRGEDRAGVSRKQARYDTSKYRDMLHEVVKDASDTIELMKQSARNAAPKERRTLGEYVHSDILFERVNAAIIYKSAKLGDLKAARENVVLDKHQFSDGIITRVQKTAINKSGKSLVWESLINKTEDETRTTRTYKGARLVNTGGLNLNADPEKLNTDQHYAAIVKTKMNALKHGLDKDVVHEERDAPNTTVDLHIGPIGTKYMHKYVSNADETVDEL